MIFSLYLYLNRIIRIDRNDENLIHSYLTAGIDHSVFKANALRNRVDVFSKEKQQDVFHPFDYSNRSIPFFFFFLFLCAETHPLKTFKIILFFSPMKLFEWL